MMLAKQIASDVYDVPLDRWDISRRSRGVPTIGATAAPRSPEGTTTPIRPPARRDADVLDHNALLTAFPSTSPSSPPAR
jgi:hypothetical protein